MDIIFEIVSVRTFWRIQLGGSGMASISRWSLDAPPRGRRRTGSHLPSRFIFRVASNRPEMIPGEDKAEIAQPTVALACRHPRLPLTRKLICPNSCRRFSGEDSLAACRT